MTARTLDLSPRKLALIMLATILVLAAATWFLLVVPKRDTATSLQTDIQHAQSQLRHAHAKTSKLKAQRTALNELRLNRAMPNILAMPQVVIQLSRVAHEVNVSLDSITPQPAIPYSGYTEVPMTVVITGEFFGVESFLRELRTQVQASPASVHAIGRLFDVQGVTLQQTTPAPKVTATLTIDAFYYTGIPLAPPVTATAGTGAAGP